MREWNLNKRRLPALAVLLVTLWLSSLLSGCSLPQVKAEDRLFLPLSLDFLGVYQLPKLDFQETRVGGLSGLTYDRQQDRFYAISDDRSNFAPARFYTLKLTLNPVSESPALPDSAADLPNPDPANPDPANPSTSVIRSVEIEQVTILKGENGEPFANSTVDLEGIALSPRQSLFISSEGDTSQGIDPFIDEFDLATGNWRGRLPIPTRYLPRIEAEQASGVQNNQGFESLTLNAGSYGSSQLEPFRLFAATESALAQDVSPTPEAATPIRLLHYLIGEDQSLILDEHLYLVDPAPEGVENQGLSDLLVLAQGGHFLGLERSFGITGFGGKLYQLVMGGATDITSIPNLSGGTEGITPIYKRLLLDFSDLGIPLDNFEGMALGPQLSDGSQSLVVISDDNFNELQTTELLLFRLRQK
ncbi:MAG: esterase-like activity of phytase family protein [Cyanobacteria bacterium RM1_2_2]|nr:esterase-like activity of phytase family protein [Cyanobacteria bacterium RM1_2_2]